MIINLHPSWHLGLGVCYQRSISYWSIALPFLIITFERINKNNKKVIVKYDQKP